MKVPPVKENIKPEDLFQMDSWLKVGWGRRGEGRQVGMVGKGKIQLKSPMKRHCGEGSLRAMSGQVPSPHNCAKHQPSERLSEGFVRLFCLQWHLPHNKQYDIL